MFNSSSSLNLSDEKQNDGTSSPAFDYVDVQDFESGVFISNCLGGINMRTYKAIDIANYIVKQSIEKEIPISNLRLQVILCYL